MVNNAGIETRSSVLDTTEETTTASWPSTSRARSSARSSRARQFIAQGGGGVVVNISSVHEDWPMPGNAAYCVSKGGMRMLTRNAGVELGEHGIRVVGIGPGAVDTPINAATTADPGTLAASGTRSPRTDGAPE